MVDRRVRANLQEGERRRIVGGSDVDVLRVHRDNAARDRDALALGIADRVHALAHGDGIGVRDRRRRSGTFFEYFAVLHAQNGNIVIDRAAHIRCGNGLGRPVKVDDDIVAHVRDGLVSRAVCIVHNVEIGDDIGVPHRLVDGIDHARARGVHRLRLGRGTAARRLDILRERALDARDGVDRRVHAHDWVGRRLADLFKKIDKAPRISVRKRLFIEFVLAGGRSLRGEEFFARVRRPAAYRDLGGRVPVRRRRTEQGTACKRNRHHRRNEQ